MSKPTNRKPDTCMPLNKYYKALPVARHSLELVSKMSSGELTPTQVRQILREEQTRQGSLFDDSRDDLTHGVQVHHEGDE